MVCVNPDNGETWIIEAKGKTAQIGLDFRTCLGQLILAMDNESVKYGIAVPVIPQYQDQLNKINKHVRKALNLHWILVEENGDIRIITPESVIE